MSLQDRTASLLKIHAGEGRLVLFMLIFGFFLGIPRHFVYTTSYALFLANFDANLLPFVYFGFATVVPIAGLIYARLGERTRYSRLVLGSLLFLLACLLVFWLWLGNSSSLWPIMAFAIWYWLLSILSVVAFWGVAGQLFNVRQGKRLFGVIGVGDSLASIIGGLSISLLVRSLGTLNLLWVAMASLAIAILIMLAITRAFSAKLNIVLETEPKRASPNETTEGFFQSRYVTMILITVVLSIVTYFFLDNIFFGLAEMQYTEEADLASFIGIFSALVGATTLISQIFVSGAVLTRFGVRAGILLLPVVVAGGLLLVTLTGFAMAVAAAAFWLATITKIFDRGLRDSVDRSSLQTLYQPFTAGRRAQIIATVDGVVEPIAAGIAGLGLLLLNSAFSFDPAQLALPALIIAAGWLLVANDVGRQYPQMLLQALRRRRLTPTDLSLTDQSSIAAIKHAVNDPNPAVALHALNLLETSDDDSLALLLPTLLQHPAHEVRLAAVERIKTRGLTSSFVRALLRDDIESETSPEVKGAALRALAALFPEDVLSVVAAYLEDAEIAVRRGALVGLFVSENEEAIARAEAVVDLLAKRGERQDRILAAQVIGEARVSDRYDLLLPLSDDVDPGVQRTAMVAAGQAQSPALWQHVIDALGRPKVAGAAATALIAGRDSSLPEMRLNFDVGAANPELDRAKLARLAQVCGRIRGAAMESLLKSQLDYPNFDVRTQILHALSQCRYHAAPEDVAAVDAQLQREASDGAWILAAQQDVSAGTIEQGRAEMLQRALDAALFCLRQRVFYLLSFIYDQGAILRARDNFSHPALDKRAYALEVVDVLLTQEHKNLLFPLLRDLEPETRLHQLARHFPQQTLSAPRRLLDLIAAPAGQINAWTTACAIYATAGLPHAEITETTVDAVSVALASPEPFVREAAFWSLYEIRPDQLAGALAALQETDIPAADLITRLEELSRGDSTMLSTIERVLFLRSVDLFEEVPDDVLAWVAQAAQEVHLDSGERFITQGDLGDSLYVIVEGGVDVLIEGKGQVATRGPRSVHGEMGILVSQPRTASCVATTDTISLKIEREDFLELLGEAPELALGVIHVLVERLDEVSQKAAVAAA